MLYVEMLNVMSYIKILKLMSFNSKRITDNK